MVRERGGGQRSRDRRTKPKSARSQLSVKELGKHVTAGTTSTRGGNGIRFSFKNSLLGRSCMKEGVQLEL